MSIFNLSRVFHKWKDFTGMFSHSRWLGKVFQHVSQAIPAKLKCSVSFSARAAREQERNSRAALGVHDVSMLFRLVRQGLGGENWKFPLDEKIYLFFYSKTHNNAMIHWVLLFYFILWILNSSSFFVSWIYTIFGVPPSIWRAACVATHTKTFKHQRL